MVLRIALGAGFLSLLFIAGCNSNAPAITPTSNVDKPLKMATEGGGTSKPVPAAVEAVSKP